MTSFDTHFKILALAPFQPEDAGAVPKPPQVVERSTLDDVMHSMAIRLPLNIEKSLCPNGSLEFQLANLKSFHPDGIVKSNPFFQKLSQAKAYLEAARRKGETTSRIREGLHQWPELPTIDIQEKKPPAKSKSESNIDNILSMVALDGTETAEPGSHQDEADQIDTVAKAILTALFGDHRFQEMESAWRGLRLLLQQGVSDNASATVSIATVHTQTLAERLDDLTPLIVNDLPNVILLDLPFDNTPLSIERLTAAARWSTTLMVPVIAWVPPAFFQIPKWSRLGTLPLIRHHIETQAYAKYQSVVQSEYGHWLCLTCNRFLVRYPYGEDNQPRLIPFNEPDVNWIAPVWSLGTLVAQSAYKEGWPTRFCDVQKYQIQDLALQTGGELPPMVSEAQFDRDRLEQFVQGGFTPLACETKRDVAFFPKAVVINGTSLAYQILLSQVTQFILWCKDHISSEGDPGHLEEQLKTALNRFSDQSDPPGFAKAAIDVQPIDQQGRIPVAIKLTPSSTTLPGQHPIELHLGW